MFNIRKTTNLFYKQKRKRAYRSIYGQHNKGASTSLKIRSSAAAVSSARTRRKIFFTSGWTLSIFSKSTACQIVNEKQKKKKYGIKKLR
jgi:hypothetical protein